MHAKASNELSPVYQYQFIFDGQLSKKKSFRDFALPGKLLIIDAVVQAERQCLTFERGK